jgi:yeast amino acid transporter
MTIPWFIFDVYLFCTHGEALNVKWTNLNLPPIYGGVGNHAFSTGNTSLPVNSTGSTSIPVNIAFAAGYPRFAGILNGFIIFSFLSSSNTSLYVASRTLYGLTREIPDTNWVTKFFRMFSLVDKYTGVPVITSIFSTISFVGSH